MLQTGRPEHMRRVLVIPEFGDLSDRMIKILSSENPEGLHTYLYRESTYERKKIRLVAQILRSVVHVLPLNDGLRSSFECRIAQVRFRQREMVRDLFEFAKGVEAEHLILVKPFYLREDSLGLVQRAIGARLVTLVLWDAIWRTPDIANLLPIVDKAFSTEPSDVARYPNLAELPTPKRLSEQSEASRSGIGADPDQEIDFFSCASWSLDRFMAFRSIIRAVHETGNTFRFHLVTTNALLMGLNRFVGLNSERLSPDKHAAHVARCTVHVDVGRRGQSSPSERLAESADAGTLLVTGNPWVGSLGYPVVDASGGWSVGVRKAIEQWSWHSPNERRECWYTSAAFQSHLMTTKQWADDLLSVEKASKNVDSLLNEPARNQHVFSSE
jgi:hypothetical protein